MTQTERNILTCLGLAVLIVCLGAILLFVSVVGQTTNAPAQQAAVAVPSDTPTRLPPQSGALPSELQPPRYRHSS